MIGRTPSYIVAVRPLRKGAITDFDTTQRMIRLILQQVGVGRFGKTRVVVCVPSVITPVERRAVTDAARRAGASDVRLIDQPMAAAIGSGLPIHEPIGNMVIDVGGGTAETAMVSMGGIVSLKAIRVGSFDFDGLLFSDRRSSSPIRSWRSASICCASFSSASSLCVRLRHRINSLRNAASLPASHLFCLLERRHKTSLLASCEHPNVIATS